MDPGPLEHIHIWDIMTIFLIQMAPTARMESLFSVCPDGQVWACIRGDRTQGGRSIRLLVACVLLTLVCNR